MKKTRFYVVRHGESEGNVDLKKTEQDPPLTRTGIEQVLKRKKDLIHISFDNSYSSHLTRAMQTNSILLEGTNINHTVNEQLREREYGDFFFNPDFNRIVDEIIVANNALSIPEWWEYKHQEAESIETYKQCFTRFFSEVEQIARMNENQTVLLVSHGDLMRSLLVFSGYGSHKEYGWDAVKNTGYIVMDLEAGSFPEIIQTVDIVRG